MQPMHLLVQEALENVVLVLAPIVPHLGHALWLQLGHTDPVIDAAWPEADDSARAADSVTLVVQVNGKLRARIDIAAGLDKRCGGSGCTGGRKCPAVYRRQGYPQSYRGAREVG